MKEWIPGWGYRMTDFSLFPIYAENETQRIWFWNNLYADKMRIRLSNRYGREPLPLEQVTVAPCNKEGEIDPECVRIIRFDGKEKLTLKEEEETVSDPVEIDAKPGMWISISIYIKEKTRITSAISSQSRLITRMSSQKGDACFLPDVKGQRFPGNAELFMKLKPLYNLVAAAVTGAEFYCEEKNNIKILAVFGDSITQHGHWSEALTRKLYEVLPGRISVTNHGICGNRLLHDASIRSKFGRYFGEAGYLRFEEDLWPSEKSRADMVLVEEGVNDIIQPFDATCAPYEKVSSEEILNGFRKIVRIAHSHGTKIAGASLLPFRGFNNVWNQETETMRRDINRGILEGDIFDKALDFAAFLQDPYEISRLKDKYDCGDHLHPNIIGGEKIAQNIADEVIKISGG